LLSRTSALFGGDDVLDTLLFVDEHDNPDAIALAARRLLKVASREGIVHRAQEWMRSWNERTEPQRDSFFNPPA
jgi:hypothetical protein